MVDVPMKLCGKCGKEKALNTDNFYPARPTATHPKGGWQSHCRDCWREINRIARENRKRVISELSS